MKELFKTGGCEWWHHIQYSLNLRNGAMGVVFDSLQDTRWGNVLAKEVGGVCGQSEVTINK